MIEQDDILGQVEAFLESHGMGSAAFGRMTLNDPNFVTDLRAGRDIRRSTIVRLRKFMADYRPHRPRKGRSGNGVQAAA